MKPWEIQSRPSGPCRSSCRSAARAPHRRRAAPPRAGGGVEQPDVGEERRARLAQRYQQPVPWSHSPETEAAGAGPPVAAGSRRPRRGRRTRGRRRPCRRRAPEQIRDSGFRIDRPGVVLARRRRSAVHLEAGPRPAEPAPGAGDAAADACAPAGRRGSRWGLRRAEIGLPVGSRGTGAPHAATIAARHAVRATGERGGAGGSIRRAITAPRARPAAR